MCWPFTYVTIWNTDTEKRQKHILMVSLHLHIEIKSIPYGISRSWSPWRWRPLLLGLRRRPAPLGLVASAPAPARRSAAPTNRLLQGAPSWRGSPAGSKQHCGIIPKKNMPCIQRWLTKKTFPKCLALRLLVRHGTSWYRQL